MQERNRMYPYNDNSEVISRSIMNEMSRARTWATIEVGNSALLNMRRIRDSINEEMDMLNSKEDVSTTPSIDDSGESQ